MLLGIAIPVSLLWRCSACRLSCSGAIAAPPQKHCAVQGDTVGSPMQGPRRSTLSTRAQPAQDRACKFLCSTQPTVAAQKTCPLPTISNLGVLPRNPQPAATSALREWQQARRSTLHRTSWAPQSLFVVAATCTSAVAALARNSSPDLFEHMWGVTLIGQTSRKSEAGAAKNAFCTAQHAQHRTNRQTLQQRRLRTFGSG